jgi:hypothetical protein
MRHTLQRKSSFSPTRAWPATHNHTCPHERTHTRTHARAARTCTHRAARSRRGTSRRGTPCRRTKASASRRRAAGSSSTCGVCASVCARVCSCVRACTFWACRRRSCLSRSGRCTCHGRGSPSGRAQPTRARAQCSSYGTTSASSRSITTHARTASKAPTRGTCTHAFLLAALCIARDPLVVLLVQIPMAKAHRHVDLRACMRACECVHACMIVADLGRKCRRRRHHRSGSPRLVEGFRLGALVPV